ncbi:MAG: 16S rRNA (guanine(527)-N(7))-methyltransferase RsmG [Chloroflexi bacterium]|nr:16S rRNA (guanine(527)-N(7))-methyltransferase RsmG [Chloroflexota bacterium]
MKNLTDAARAFQVALTTQQLDAFEIYLRELTEWNTRVNLTAIIERDQVVLKHFLDSLSVVPALPTDARTLLDVGSGAGFPGVPLKIVRPELRVTLLESVGKKVAFLQHLIARLDLRDTAAIHARAEDLAREAAHRDKYDVVVARAVADLAVLAEYALPFVRVGGVFIAQKGVAIDDEVQRATRALRILGGQVSAITPVQLPGLEPRHLVVIAKIAPTSETFPRRAGIPERKPL